MPQSRNSRKSGAAVRCRQDETKGKTLGRTFSSNAPSSHIRIHPELISPFNRVLYRNILESITDCRCNSCNLRAILTVIHEVFYGFLWISLTAWWIGEHQPDHLAAIPGRHMRQAWNSVKSGLPLEAFPRRNEREANCLSLCPPALLTHSRIRAIVIPACPFNALSS
jgi:hypothetical protein